MRRAIPDSWVRIERYKDTIVVTRMDDLGNPYKQVLSELTEKDLMEALLYDVYDAMVDNGNFGGRYRVDVDVYNRDK
jgi:hypothetical protein